MKRLIYISIVSMLVSGCAVNSGVLKISEDTYKVSRQAATGFEGSSGIRDGALQEANEFCAKQGKCLKVILIGGHHPPYIFGNFPKVDIQFKCLSPNDPELKQRDLETIQQSGQGKDIGAYNSDELVNKLKTLNKLLSDGLITKNEFEQRKQKLLDDYMSKKN